MRFIAWLIIAVVLASPAAASVDPESTPDPPQVPLVVLCLNVDPCVDNGPAPCRIWEWYDDDPQVSVNPLLGLIVLDPDGCINQFVKNVLDLVPGDALV